MFFIAEKHSHAVRSETGERGRRYRHLPALDQQDRYILNRDFVDLVILYHQLVVPNRDFRPIFDENIPISHICSFLTKSKTFLFGNFVIHTQNIDGIFFYSIKGFYP